MNSIEIMRRSSRRSHHLRSKQARTIAVREPNAAGTRCGARQAVTSAVRGGGAHVLEPFSHVVGWYNSRPSRSSTARLVALDPPFGGLSSPGGSHSGSQPNAAPVQLHLSDRPDTLACPGCTHPDPLEHHCMRRHVLLALKASHLTVAERCVLGVLGEPAAQDRLRDLLLDGRGQRRRQSGGRRPVGCDAAAFMPLSEAAGAQNERWEAMAQRRSVCQGALYVVWHDAHISISGPPYSRAARVSELLSIVSRGTQKCAVNSAQVPSRKTLLEL